MKSDFEENRERRIERYKGREAEGKTAFGMWLDSLRQEYRRVRRAVR